MHAKQHIGKDNLVNNRLNIYLPSNELNTFSSNLRNWKSVSNIYLKKKGLGLDDIKSYLRKYFTNHMSIIHQNCKNNDYIDKQTFEHILRR